MTDPSADEYTPSTEAVLGAWVDRMWNSTVDDEQGAEFDRWLAEVKAAAWDECLTKVMSKVGDDGLIDQHTIAFLRNPYRP